MKWELTRHKWAYAILAGILLLFVVTFMAVWPNRQWQRVLIIGLVLSYILWGAITHVKAQHITKQILYEYIGIAVLAGAMLYMVTV
jgi:hypothetical protein